MVIIYPHSKLNGENIFLLLNLGHGWIVSDHISTLVWLHIHALNPLPVEWISGSKWDHEITWPQISGLGLTTELELELGSTPTPELELELELKPPELELELELELIFWKFAGVGVGVETPGVGIGVETLGSWSWSWSWSWNFVNFLYQCIIWNIWIWKLGPSHIA